MLTVVLVHGALSNTSETYKVLVNRGLDAATASNVVQQLPLYWGDQPIVSGPVYAGAIILFPVYFRIIYC